MAEYMIESASRAVPLWRLPGPVPNPSPYAIPVDYIVELSPGSERHQKVVGITYSPRHANSITSWLNWHGHQPPQRSRGSYHALVEF